MLRAHVNIGSNLGESLAMVERAAGAIERDLKVEVKRSAPVTSEPWGYESASAYVNMGICFDTRLDGATLLRRLLDIERSISPASHRNADGSYADRLIDIDLIALGDTVGSTPSLILPHPRMHLRPFVLIPMRELDPTWRHPLTGLTPGEMLSRLI